MIRSPGIPPLSAVRFPERPCVFVPDAPARWRALSQRLEHHLLVVASNDHVESLRRVGSGNPVLRRRGIGAAVDQVPQAEDAVVLSDLELGEHPAQSREVPVHVTDHEVAALPRFGLRWGERFVPLGAMLNVFFIN